jgi:predicted Rossmann fold flavoprotein
MSASSGIGVLPIIVIGSGPAGLMAAIAAAEESKKVILYNKNPWPGKKVAAIPAEEFCLTEKLTPAKMAARFGNKANFVGPIFRNYSYTDLLKFIKQIGYKLKEDETGRFKSNGYPAKDIMGAISQKAMELNIEIFKSARVTDIVINEGKVDGITVNGVLVKAGAVILATGSISSPKYGSTMDGYKIAHRLGHRICDIKPAMVDLFFDEKVGKLLGGKILKNAKVTVLFGGKAAFSDISNIRFAATSISGPVILNYSAEIIEKLGTTPVEIGIDLLPQLTREQLETLLSKETAARSYKLVSEFLGDYIDGDILKAVATVTNVAIDKAFSKVTNLERKAIVLAIKDFRLTIKGSKPFNYTRGVLGGVCTDSIDPETCQSKLVKSLYFSGAIMDVLGPWGGFNMQFAFSSGYVAGKAAAASK